MDCITGATRSREIRYADRQLVLSFFSGEPAADAAAMTLKESGLTSGDAMGILVAQTVPRRSRSIRSVLGAPRPGPLAGGVGCRHKGGWRRQWGGGLEGRRVRARRVSGRLTSARGRPMATAPWTAAPRLRQPQPT